ncbi:helix-turn-helix domain-containing protein [Clostridium beijerinckii]|jgi:Transposase.|uniref:helix-turn-helix domain-containing protein n=1 Tax=Clostridium beijerinckii TaxID=1520 RepID=UPI00232FD8CA|nr:helix-turn-helix domain-containing protein [Clostridium beijerinckii]
MSVINVEKDKMIEMYLSNVKITEIAKKLNVSRQTIYAWLKEKEVIAEVEERRQQLKKIGQNKITQNVCTCIDNVIEIANNCTDPRVRFNANKYIIDQGLGSPSAAKEDNNTNSTGKENTDKNTLQAELNDLKNLTVVR